MASNVDNLNVGEASRGSAMPAASAPEVLPGNAKDAAHQLIDHNTHAASTSHRDGGGDGGREEAEPIWYLAYGSNLCSSVFRGRRKIVPLQQRNVFVPGLELVFDLAGLPFIEPRFANARSVRDAARTASVLNEDGSPRYDWEAPWTGVGALLGVAYLVTPTDFNKILATEGGGATYKMVATDAHVLASDAYPSASSGSASGSGKNLETHALTGEKLRAYTLIAPEDGNRVRSGDGHPSLRYLNLIRAGAKEHSLPLTYRAYLDTLRPYHANTVGRKVGRLANMSIFFPILTVSILVAPRLAAPDGSYPRWLVAFQIGIFETMWFLHDWIHKPLFGVGCGEKPHVVVDSGSNAGVKEE